MIKTLHQEYLRVPRLPEPEDEDEDFDIDLDEDEEGESEAKPSMALSSEAADEEANKWIALGWEIKKIHMEFVPLRDGFSVDATGCVSRVIILIWPTKSNPKYP